MTREEIRDGYGRRHGRVMEEADYEAFLRFMEMFDVKAVSYEDACSQIEQKMEERMQKYDNVKFRCFGQVS